MKIKSIELENFRGFYGIHEIKFSTDPHKLITLIVAENGTGKSNMMESINWCLYGTLPAQADRPDEIKNDIADPRSEVKVTLTVIDDKVDTPTGDPIEYTISRNQAKDGVASTLLVYHKHPVSGNLTTQSRPKSLIESLLPERLTPYFLYSGEGILGMFKDQEEQELKDSIEDMQGLTYAREASLYLSNYSSSMLTKIKRQGSQQTKILNAQRKLTDAIVTITKNFKALQESQKKIKEINRKVQVIIDKIAKSNNEIIKEKKKQNIDLEIIRKREGTKLENLRVEKNKLISSKGFQVLSLPLKGEIKKYFKEQRDAGVMPARFGEVTLHGVLENEECICGRPVKEHSDNEDYTKAWKFINDSFDEAGTEDQSAAQTMIEELLKILSYDNKQLRKGFMRINSDIIETEEIIKSTSKAIKDNQELIDSTPRDENIDSLLLKEQELKESLSKEEKKSFEATNKKNTAEETKKEQEKIIKANTGSSDYKEIEKQKSFVDECIEKLDKKIQDLVIEGRIELGDKLAIFNEKYNTKTDEYIDFLNKDSFIPVIKNEETGKARAQNTASLNLLSLFYAVSLIDICIGRHGRKEEFVQPGTIAPLVCDAPLSSLGETNSDSVIELLTVVPEQTILFVNPKDYKGTKQVLKAFKKVGSSYFSQRKQKKEPSKNSIVKMDGKDYKSFIMDKKITSNSLIDLGGKF